MASWTILVQFCVFILVFKPKLASKESETEKAHMVNCENLLPGQYRCNQSLNIDPQTQSDVGCQSTHTISVTCQLAPGINCAESNDGLTFTKMQSCRYTNGYDHETALLLSVFLGMFGIDRFYLGYPALGLLKFCTVGFFFLFHLVDVILIAMQIVGPADGSEYVLDYYGPRLSHIARNNETIFRPVG